MHGLYQLWGNATASNKPCTTPKPISSTDEVKLDSCPHSHSAFNTSHEDKVGSAAALTAHQYPQLVSVHQPIPCPMQARRQESAMPVMRWSCWWYQHLKPVSLRQSTSLSPMKIRRQKPGGGSIAKIPHQNHLGSRGDQAEGENRKKFGRSWSSNGGRLYRARTAVPSGKGTLNPNRHTIPLPVIHCHQRLRSIEYKLQRHKFSNKYSLL